MASSLLGSWIGSALSTAVELAICLILLTIYGVAVTIPHASARPAARVPLRAMRLQLPIRPAREFLLLSFPPLDLPSSFFLHISFFTCGLSFLTGLVLTDFLPQNKKPTHVW
jgi:hypothetical protein